MNKRLEKEPTLNIINPQYYQEKKTIRNLVWIIPLVVMIVSCFIMIAVIITNVYDKEKAKLELEVYSINNVVNDEFSVALNSINLNGYMEVFEQYLKTSDSDAKASIYYDEALKTLDNVTNITDNIVTTFVVSFNNNALVASGIEDDVIYNYDYRNQLWYDHKKISQNQLYVSNDFILKEVCNDSLFAIVRPLVDTMNDEPLGIVAFCYKENYLNKVFKKAVNKKIDAVIYTDTGKIVLNTAKDKKGSTMIKENNKQRKYIVIRKKNDNLNWIVETYIHWGRIIVESLKWIILVLLVYALLIYTYVNMINHLRAIKVIDIKEKIEIEPKEEIKEPEEKVEYDEKEYAIEDVLEDGITISEEYNEEDIIMAGEIIFDNKK